MPMASLNAACWVSEYITPYDVYLHGVTSVLWDRTTPYQRAQIVDSGVYGRALVLDGKWQSCTGDEFLYHEPLVQPACVLLANAGSPPRHALVLGGGEGATLRELLRWTTITRVTMVDIDREVVDACREHLRPMHRGAFDDPRAEVVIGDALEYADNHAAMPDGGWDLIISDLSDPIEDGPSFALFTREFFARLAAILAPHGVLVVQSGPVSPPEVAAHARLRRTLADVFEHTASVATMTVSYGAPWSFVLASRRPLDIPQPDAVDRLIREHTSEASAPFGGEPLAMFDGVALRGLTSLPRHLRAAIDRETTVYTDSSPRRFFGSGVLADG